MPIKDLFLFESFILKMANVSIISQKKIWEPGYFSRYSD
jgi:hypothetical protein